MNYSVFADCFPSAPMSSEEWVAEFNRREEVKRWAKETHPVGYEIADDYYSAILARPEVSSKHTQQWGVYVGGQHLISGGLTGEFVGFWDSPDAPTAEDCATLFTAWLEGMEE